jgi:parallel beta-helix repeat protein
MKKRLLYVTIFLVSFMLAGIQPAFSQPTTYISIPSDTTIGTWDSANRIYTLTTDVSETIQIDESNITLDGAGYTVELSGSGYGVYVSNKSAVTVINLNVKSCEWGIFISGGSGHTIEANTVSNIDRYGIWSNWTTGATIAGNTVFDITGGNGIRIKSSSNNIVTNNTVFNTVFDPSSAIAVKEGGSNTVTHNTTYNNADGIVLPFSHHNTISDNISYNNWRGIDLGGANYNTILDNTVYNNEYGIRVRDNSDQNSIYNNHFTYNQIQAFVSADSNGNIFDLVDPTGGNCWSDYTGTDADGDGFGDTSYTFSGGQDDLPLAQQCRPLPVVQDCFQEMISYWKFEEGSGSETAYDSVGNNDGAIAGATSTPGLVGEALHFSGYDEVTVTNNQTLNPANVTIEAWVFPTTHAYYRTVVSKLYSNSWVNPWSGYRLSIPWDVDRPAFSVAIGGQRYIKQSDSSIPMNAWSHLVCTYDGNAAKIYINGQLASTDESPTGPIDISTGPLYIGEIPGTNNRYYGKIDEVAIYDRALTQEEIQQHFINGLHGEQYCTPAPANDPPVADPGGPYLCAANVPCQFDGSLSSDLNGDELTYAWDFGDSNTGTGVTSTHIYPDAGIYDVCLTVNDGYVDSVEVCTIAVIYDPDGGFVTGGGWIDSPEGAYMPEPTLTGKATFGFVSKYKKGANTPTGNTEFQFHAGDLNFHSSSYEWLVVTGSDYAKFKGSGTINGMGDYRFSLWAGDDEPDTFRIKIWEEDEFGTEAVTYDNGMDQAISRGSIKIHTN